MTFIMYSRSNTFVEGTVKVLLNKSVVLVAYQILTSAHCQAYKCQRFLNNFIDLKVRWFTVICINYLHASMFPSFVMCLLFCICMSCSLMVSNYFARDSWPLLTCLTQTMTSQILFFQDKSYNSLLVQFNYLGTS